MGRAGLWGLGAVDVRSVAAAVVAAIVFGSGSGLAADCPGNPGAIGTSRVIAIDPTEHARIGSMQYPESLPLAHKEVVLTFDDGPLPAYTGRVLETLARECVKATFFMVGRMAQAYPDWVRRIYNSGHTVATHTHSHVTRFRRLSYEKSVEEIEQGIGAVKAALGDRRALAPFFRFPGLNASREVEGYLADRGLMVWSADIPSDDWRPISADTVLARSLARLDRKGRGVILMHDIQARTALMLPELLQELKARGYRIVHVVPAASDRPKTVSEPQAWVRKRSRVPEWPVVLRKNLTEPPDFSVPSPLSFGFPRPLAKTLTVEPFDGEGPPMVVAGFGFAVLPGRESEIVWPPSPAAAPASTASQQIPDAAVSEAAPVVAAPSVPASATVAPVTTDHEPAPAAPVAPNAVQPAPAAATTDANPPPATSGELDSLDVPSAKRVFVDEPPAAASASRRTAGMGLGSKDAAPRRERDGASWSRKLNWSYTR